MIIAPVPPQSFTFHYKLFRISISLLKVLLLRQTEAKARM
jgi:hypothetical protein